MKYYFIPNQVSIQLLARLLCRIDNYKLMLTLVLLNRVYCIFRHLKLELLPQFPASNDKKYLYFLKIDIF